jgi:formylglycine-generating enzyme required for sulfatase activity
MKPTRLFLSALLAFSAVPFLTSAQPAVSNVTFDQQPSGTGTTEIVVNYDLASPDRPSTTTLLYSLNAAPFTPATSVSGDVGPGQTTGTLTIDWAVANDLPGVESSNLVVRVLAEDGVAIPLAITSTLAEASVTQTASQTLTFTFAEPVTGFDDSDVTVTNATKGAFAGSGAVYTLDITANAFDTVSVTVPAGIALSSSGSANGNASAGFEFHFEELLEFVSAPGGIFTMGRGPADLQMLLEPNEVPNHQVTLSPYDIGKFEVTNAQFATVMNWALAAGYLADNSSGDPYDGGDVVYLMAPDSISTRRALFNAFDGSNFSQLEWTGSAFTPRTRDSQSMADHPVVEVSWFGAVAFCNFLAELQGKPLAYDLSTWELVDADPLAAGLQYVASYRLPTESEWERAAGWTADLTTRFNLPYQANSISDLSPYTQF